LSLQRILFGPGDVEVIVMELQPTVQARSPEFFLRSLEFETALEYDPADFGVQHHTVTATTWSRKSLVQSMEQEQLTRWTTVAQDSGKAAQESPQAGAGEDNAAVPLDLPLRFLVMSWNHMFQLVVNGTTSPETMTGESLPAPLPGRISSDSVPASYHEFRLSPAYFDQDRWDHYKMFKSTESLLARNRAHPLFAREGLSSR
ncbi:MAG: hypothetical protein KDK23_01270, partial [Leptospiraceae bacterium]|nr:hypothetical protein [Leptospiraceae bacterium]